MLLYVKAEEKEVKKQVSKIDNETVAELVSEYSINMYRLSDGILHSKSDAEDAVSEAVLKAYENLKSLKKTESFKAWIMQITVNEARRIYRRSQKEIPADQIGRASCRERV